MKSLLGPSLALLHILQEALQTVVQAPCGHFFEVRKASLTSSVDKRTSVGSIKVYIGLVCVLQRVEPAIFSDHLEQLNCLFPFFGPFRSRVAPGQWK